MPDIDIVTLPMRTLGPFTVSAIGLGCMNLSHAYGITPDAQSAGRLLNHALDRGCTLLDTAALYGDGANERLLGEAVMHRRGEFTLASKCVLDVVDGKRTLDGRPEAIKATCTAALARLRTEVIDLYYLHRLDWAVPIEESVGALVDLIGEGKIRAIGLSEMGAATIARAHAVHPVAAVQSEYSLAVRNPEVAVLETCRRLGIGFVAFSPVARGMLARGIRGDNYEPRDIRRNMPRFVEPLLSTNLKLVAQFDACAGAAGCTSAQLALGWLLSRGAHVIPIPGTRSLAHLGENLTAAAMTFDPAILGQVDALFAPNALAGPRYSAAMQAQIDTEFLPGETQ